MREMRFKTKTRRRFRAALAWLLIFAVSMTSLGVDNFAPVVQAAGSYTTLYIVDDTQEHWLGNDNAVIELVDNTFGHDHYTMTKVNATTWSVRVPASTYNVTFNRLDPSSGVQWNSWSAGGRDSHDTYHAQGHEYGYWGGEAVIEGEEREYLPPVAGFTLDSSYLERDAQGIAELGIHNTAYSPDGDMLEQIRYTIFYDRNADGNFPESEVVFQENRMEEEWTYETSDVGCYRIVQTVQESIPDSLENLGYDADEIRELTVSEYSSTFEVGNVKPESGLSIRKKNCVDILFTYQALDEQQLAAYQEKGDEVAAQLREKGIDAAVEWRETQHTDRKTSFTWESYDHEQYEDPSLAALDHHVTTGGNSVGFSGYGNGDFKDFAYSELGENDYNVLSFTVEQDGFEGLEGTGMLFGASVDRKETEEGSFHGHTYQLFAPGRTWSQAKAFCEEQGGYLATVTSMEEYEYLAGHILEGDPCNMYWLGGYKAERNGIKQWRWITGEDFYWTRWAGGEPNSPSESVIEMYGRFGQKGYWNDTYDNPGTGWSYGYDNVGTLCEWNGSEISGYVLLLTGQGMKLIRLEHTDLYNLQNGAYEYLENAGTLLGTFPYETTEKIHHVKILSENGKITVEDNGNIVTTDFDLGGSPEGTAVGPIVSYTRHQTQAEYICKRYRGFPDRRHNAGRNRCTAYMEGGSAAPDCLLCGGCHAGVWHADRNRGMYPVALPGRKQFSGNRGYCRQGGVGTGHGCTGKRICG